MSKVIAIGDIHSRTMWKQIVKDNEDADKIVFIGDYFDTFENRSAAEQINNFNNIVTFKRANMNRVVLLIGNHDYHYMRGITEHYSGFQSGAHLNIQQAIHEAMDCLKMCYIHDNYMFTHAGVSRTWFEANFENVILDSKELENSINELFIQQPQKFGFTCGEYYSPTGDEKCQTPIWIRPRSLLADKLDGYVMVIGHTEIRELSLAIKDRVINIDTLGQTGEYLVIKDGEVYTDV